MISYKKEVAWGEKPLKEEVVEFRLCVERMFPRKANESGVTWYPLVRSTAVNGK